MVSGCAPQSNSPTRVSEGDAETAKSTTNAGDEAKTVDEFGIGQPEVKVLEDGTLVQRTPSSAAVTEGETYPVIGTTKYSGFNTEYLMADDRGCNSCHEDLGQTIAALGNYHHLLVADGLDVETGYEQCTTCHYEGSPRKSLGVLLHATHQIATEEPRAQCFNCHDTDPETGTMAVWDNVKYSRMNGISSIKNVSGDFAYNQDEITPNENIFNAGWLYSENDERRYADTLAGRETELDAETFNTWEISVSGKGLKDTLTWTLPELIEQAPSTTTTMKEQCEVNPIGGAMIAQAEVTGIPVSWLLEQAGLKEDAASVHFLSIDDAPTANGWAHGFNMDEFTARDVLLVYEINGERLSWSSGYPVQLWASSDFAARYRKQVVEIRVDADPIQGSVPQAEGTSRGYNKPNVGIVGTVEGQCIQAGEPYTFEGYADAFEQHISSVEFSMDGGETWTTFETPESTADRWIYWHFAWVPPADIDSAYLMQVRANTEEGRTTPVPLSMMVNAKADLAQFRAEMERK